RLQRRAEQHARVFKYELLAGFHLDLVIIDVAGPGNRSNQNAREIRFECIFGTVVGLAIGTLTVVWLDHEASLGTGSERRLQSERNRTDLRFWADVEFHSDLVARRQRTEID